MRALAGAMAGLLLLTSVAGTAIGAGGNRNVEVVDLRVNGQYGDQLGIGDPTPVLSWRMRATPASAAHRCYVSGPQVPCPADRQTGYKIQVAASVGALNNGPYLWDTDKIKGDAQTGVVYAGAPLGSRDRVVWRVRVWDAEGKASDWSAPSTIELGLLDNADWGNAKWIEYPGRTESQPLPIFARQFNVNGNVAKARLYLSGIGVQLATVNGEQLTDEVLAPGYSNWQLAAEYRTYDVTDELVNGSNTVGVQLGNGTAYVRRSVTNAAVGRTAPYSWWQSVLKGSGTLLQPAAAGATNVMPSSTANYHLGGTINIDTGDGGERIESRTITNIGTAPTTVAAQNVVGGAVAPTLTGANWIWNSAGANTSTPGTPIVVRKTFQVADPAAVASAILRVNADDGHTTWVNGTQVSATPGANNNWQTSQITDIKPLLVAGTNVIASQPFNTGGAGSFIGVAEIDGNRIVTDATWKTLAGSTPTPPAGWNTPAFDDSAWVAATVTGAYGIAPWNQNVQTPPGPNVLRVASVQGFNVGDQIRIDTGANEEIRTIQAVGTAGATGSGLTLNQPMTIVHAVGAAIENLTNPNTGISFTPALDQPHAAGALVTGSGNNIAASDASAGAAVTPRMIARLEITYANGSTDVIVSNRSWRTAFGAYVTDAWYAGSDWDARKVPVGWDEAGSDLSASAKRVDGTDVGWIDAGIAPVPNLATRLVARDAPPVRIVETFEPKSVTQPQPGVYVFDFGQNFAGWPQLNLEQAVPAGTVVRMSPAEGLNANGTINQGSLGPSGGRGTNMFNTYTAVGGGPETWRPDFQYFGMQYLEVRGLPEGYPVDEDLITGYRLTADLPISGTVTTSNDRINRIHRMAQYSFASNTMTIFTDCPGREKQSYPADYTMVMGAIERNYDLASYLRGHMRHFAEGQSMADTFMKGNVALKVPVHDVGFQGQFGDEINWGNGIIYVPAFLYELYGDLDAAASYYDEMVLFHDYIQREKAGAGSLPDHIVNAALSDWISAQQTSGEITGTWGYYVMTDKLATLAGKIGKSADAEKYGALAKDIRQAFNDRFYNTELKRYAANGGTGGTTGATQVAQAVALDSGLAPKADREAILDYLVENMYAFQSGDGWPHFSGGTVGLAPTIRALTEGGRDDVIWEALQSNTNPSYGFFLQPTPNNPDGFTTLGEQWNRGASRNHMILAQIEEWFHEGLAGIREASGSTQYRDLVIKPRLVGDISFVEGSYTSPAGLIRSQWTKDDDRFELTVEIPANTTAEVWVPKVFETNVDTPVRAQLLRTEDGYDVYRVGSGVYTFANE